MPWTSRAGSSKRKQGSAVPAGVWLRDAEALGWLEPFLGSPNSSSPHAYEPTGRVAGGLKLHPHAGPGAGQHRPCLCTPWPPPALGPSPFAAGKCIFLWVRGLQHQGAFGGRGVLSLCGERFAAVFCEWVKCLL